MKTKMAFVTSATRFRVAPTCPCGKSNKDQKFSPLKIDSNAGFCHSCGKTFYGQEEKTIYENPAPLIYQPPSYHFNQTMDKTLVGYHKNNLIKFCKSLFPKADVESLAAKYGIGSFSHNGNITVFWQKDEQNKVRGGKVIKYNSITGKRLKYPELLSPVTWMHIILKLPNFKIKQCLFGLHLISGNKKPIAIVESEKTAFIMSLIDNTRLWLATGGKNNFKYDLLKCLKERTIEAYPDNGEYDLWKNTADAMQSKGIVIKVSRRLEKTENLKGWDLADEYIRKLHSSH